MSGGKSRSSSRQQSGSFIDPAQAPFLDFLRTQGQGLAQGMLGGGSGFQQGVVNPAMQAFGDIVAGPQQNPFLMGQIEQGQQAINRNLTENILPELTSSAIGAGQLGGSRGGIAAGIAGRGAIEEQANLAQNLLAQDYQAQQQRQLQGLALAPMIAGLQFAPLTNLAQLIGRPTVLNQASGRSGSQSKQMGFSPFAGANIFSGGGG